MQSMLIMRSALTLIKWINSLVLVPKIGRQLLNWSGNFSAIGHITMIIPMKLYLCVQVAH